VERLWPRRPRRHASPCRGLTGDDADGLPRDQVRQGQGVGEHPRRTAVGWPCLASGQTTVERCDLTGSFRAALADHYGPLALRGPEGTLPGLPSWPGPTSRPAGRDKPPGHGPRQSSLRCGTAPRSAPLLARAFDVKTDERAWRVGAEAVGGKLDQLTKLGWHVLHVVPVDNRGSDIDHVLIGHGGVYTVNTKTHPGKSVWVDRHAIKFDGHSVPCPLRRSSGHSRALPGAGRRGQRDGPPHHDMDRVAGSAPTVLRGQPASSLPQQSPGDGRVGLYAGFCPRAALRHWPGGRSSLSACRCRQAHAVYPQARASSPRTPAQGPRRTATPS
jgi:hypothetical protein